MKITVTCEHGTRTVEMGGQMSATGMQTYTRSLITACEACNHIMDGYRPIVAGPKFPEGVVKY